VRPRLNHQVDRARPPVADWWAAAGGPAFPSGHTTAAAVVAGLGAWALAQRVTSRRARSAVWAGAVAYAMLVGWSRYWLGVHWPSDVLGGWLLGAAWVALVVSVVSTARRRSVPAPALES
jgi:undecaprenyl-diphosphatase